MPSYYSPSGKPLNQTRGLAADVRSEFQLIEAGFALLPVPDAVAGGYSNYSADTGAADAYVATLGTAVLAYVDGLTVLFKAANANTGASTMNVNALGLKTITRADGSALQAGDILAGQIVQLSYSTTNGKFQLYASGAASSALAAAASASAAAGSAGAASGSASAASTSAGYSATSAANAAASEAAAANYAAALSGTSASSVLIGTGAKSFAASAGKQWVPGQFLTIASTANNANFMHGQVTSYNSVTGGLVMSISDIGGAGAFSSWLVSVSGTQGPIGLTTPFLAVIFISTNTTATAGNCYVMTAACTLTLPASPPVNANVGVVVLAGVTGAIVDPGAEKIRNFTGSMSVDTAPFSANLIYTGASYGWV